MNTSHNIYFKNNTTHSFSFTLIEINTSTTVCISKNLIGTLKQQNSPQSVMKLGESSYLFAIQIFTISGTCFFI